MMAFMAIIPPRRILERGHLFEMFVLFPNFGVAYNFLKRFSFAE